MNFLRRLFRHSGERGFSLTEILVGGAVLAGLAVAGGKMFKDQKNAQKRVDHEQALVTFHNSLVRLLHDANNCNATMSAFYNQTPVGSQTVTSIYRCSSCTSDFNYDADPTVINAVREATPWITAGANSWIENVNLNTNKETRTWILKDMVMTFPSTSGKGVLRVEYQMNPQLPNGGRRVHKDVNLNLRYGQNGGGFKECLSGQESSVSNLQKDICEGMGDQISSTGQIMEWDDSTQECVRKGLDGTKVKTCPAGMIVEGIRSDGSVHCKSPVDGVNPSQDLILSSPCAPGTSVKLVIVDGKLVTECQ